MTDDGKHARVARRVLAYACWLMVVWIVIGYLTMVPAIDRRITAAEGSAIGREILGVLLVAVLLTALVIWGAALWHATIDREPHLVPRGMLIAILMLGNFVAGFFYYFLFVHWLPERNVTARGESRAPSPSG